MSLPPVVNKGLLHFGSTACFHAEQTISSSTTIVESPVSDSLESYASRLVVEVFEIWNGCILYSFEICFHAIPARILLACCLDMGNSFVASRGPIPCSKHLQT